MPRDVLLGATNAYQMCLYVTHSKSVQLHMQRFMFTQRLYQKVTSRPLPRWIHRHKQTAMVCRIDIVIVLLLPARSVIDSLSQAKNLVNGVQAA